MVGEIIQMTRDVRIYLGSKQARSMALVKERYKEILKRMDGEVATLWPEAGPEECRHYLSTQQSCPTPVHVEALPLRDSRNRDQLRKHAKCASVVSVWHKLGC